MSQAERIEEQVAEIANVRRLTKELNVALEVLARQGIEVEISELEYQTIGSSVRQRSISLKLSRVL